jgi:hypothetical protein
MKEAMHSIRYLQQILSDVISNLICVARRQIQAAAETYPSNAPAFAFEDWLIPVKLRHMTKPAFLWSQARHSEN